MFVIRARNVNGAWDNSKAVLNDLHVVRPSRVGEVWEYPTPVTTVYAKPTERVLFNPQRNANPFFHFFEALWMLAGHNDVEWIAQFNNRMREYSDDGDTFHGAYGHRWRYAFDMDGGAEDGYADQLPKIVRMLKKSPDERRAVLTMFNPLWDLERSDVKDIPCNTQVYFKIRNGKLTATVTCRSNDIVWGAYGANAVHFSMLQEYMAAMIGVPVGPLYQISDSWHAYTAVWEKFGGNDLTPTLDCYQVKPYGLKLGEITAPLCQPFPLVEYPDSWDEELRTWMLRRSEPNYRNRFFPIVAEPLWQAWAAYKAGDLNTALEHASLCAASDWRIAALNWLLQIKYNREAKAGMETAV